ncbi:hypothetical protein L6V77_27240 [Myxococcota bacterium]|nr:hypothetical protein [Myxococcota bacterium]
MPGAPRTPPPGERRLLGPLAAVALVCFAYAFVAALQAPAERSRYDGEQRAVADPYDRGPFGFRGLVETLVELGVPVTVNRRAPALLATEGVVLVGLPWVEGEARRALRRSLDDLGGRTLALVLPKWRPAVGSPGAEDAAGPVYEAIPLPEVEAFAAALGFEVRLESAPPPAVLRTPTHERPIVLRAPRRFAAAAPARGDDADAWDCLMALDTGGCLEARRDDGARSVHLFAEPDLFANFGFVQADHAQAVIDVLEHVRADGPVVFDARAHGYDVPVLWATLFEPPLVFASVHLLLLGIAAVFAGWPRFGAAVDEAPALSAGRRALVANTVMLLHRGGHAPYALGRYWQAVARDVARRLRVPGEDHAARVRGLALVSPSAAELAALDAAVSDAIARRLDPRSILRLARRIAGWRTRLISGRAGRSVTRSPS